MVVVRIGFRMVQPTTSQWFRHALRSGTRSRVELARPLDALDESRNARQALCATSAMASAELPCPLEDLGNMRLCLATTPQRTGRWTDLLAAEHRLGWHLAPGAQPAYATRDGART